MSPRIGSKPSAAKAPAAATSKRAPAKKPSAKKPATPRKRAPAKKPGPPPEPLSAVKGVEQDLAELAKLDPKLATSALAAVAMQLARELDDRENLGAAKASCARALADTLNELRARAPEAAKEDGLDEIAKRRAARLAGGRAGA